MSNFQANPPQIDPLAQGFTDAQIKGLAASINRGDRTFLAKRGIVSDGVKYGTRTTPKTKDGRRKAW